jgi:hypothetical protein
LIAVISPHNYYSQFYHLSFLLGGSLVTMAWRVLRLRMEGTASRYGG